MGRYGLGSHYLFLFEVEQFNCLLRDSLVSVFNKLSVT
jgi:hypothetical protein